MKKVVGIVLALLIGFVSGSSYQANAYEAKVEADAQLIKEHSQAASKMAESALKLIQRLVGSPQFRLAAMPHDSEIWVIFDARLFEVGQRGNDPKELYGLTGEILTFVWTSILHMKDPDTVISQITQEYWAQKEAFDKVRSTSNPSGQPTWNW